MDEHTDNLRDTIVPRQFSIAVYKILNDIGTKGGRKHRCRFGNESAFVLNWLV